MRQLAGKNTGHDAMGASAQRKKSGQQGGLAADIASSPAMLAQRKRLDGMFGGAIQRKEDEEPLQGRFEAVQRKEDEEPLQGKFAPVQRVEDEEPLQGRFETAQRVEDEEPLQGKFEAASAIQRKGGAARPNNTGLPDNLKSGIESLSGMSMDNVKVHYNSSQPAQLNAHAYAQGTDIHVAPGQEQHLPHEAWHVVQQAQGRVRPTMQMKQGVPVNDDHSLEHEADVMGAVALEAGQSTAPRSDTAGYVTSLYSTTYQLLADVYSKEHFEDPEAYIASKYPDSNINEDAGSGGIQDEPMRNLVENLANHDEEWNFPEKNRLAGKLEENGDSKAAGSLRDLVWDRETAYDWVLKNSLSITKKAPLFLTLSRRASEEEPDGEPHTFHRDHGFVLLSNEYLEMKGITGSEQSARRKLANGPFEKGWVRGHYGVDNRRHRFIEHIHVDKDKSDDERFEIYNTNDKADGTTADNFNINDRTDLIEDNDGRAKGAAKLAEDGAKKLSWETYVDSLED